MYNSNFIGCPHFTHLNVVLSFSRSIRAEYTWVRGGYTCEKSYYLWEHVGPGHSTRVESHTTSRSILNQHKVHVYVELMPPTGARNDFRVKQYFQSNHCILQPVKIHNPYWISHTPCTISRTTSANLQNDISRVHCCPVAFLAAKCHC